MKICKIFFLKIVFQKKIQKKISRKNSKKNQNIQNKRVFQKKKVKMIKTEKLKIFTKSFREKKIRLK